MAAARFVIAAVAGALLIAATLPRAHPAPPSGRAPAQDPRWSAEPSLAVIRPAPDFTLVDLGGRAVHLAEMRGKVVLLSFIYTTCPSTCPLVTARIAQVQRRLSEARLLPSRVTLLSVTVDPERDSRAALARYAKGFGADAEGWRFLRDSPERMRQVLTSYDEWTKRLPNGEIDHPARVYLIDRESQIREIYSLALFDERQAFLDIKALL